MNPPSKYQRLCLALLIITSMAAPTTTKNVKGATSLAQNQSLWYNNRLPSGAIFKDDLIQLDILSLYKGPNAVDFSFSNNTLQEGTSIVKPWDGSTLKSFDISKDAGLNVTITSCGSIVRLSNGEFAVICDKRYLVFFKKSMQDPSVSSNGYLDILGGDVDDKSTCQDIVHSVVTNRIYIVCEGEKPEGSNYVPLYVFNIGAKARNIRMTKIEQNDLQNLRTSPYAMTVSQADGNVGEALQILDHELSFLKGFNIIYQGSGDVASNTYFDITKVRFPPTQRILFMKGDSTRIIAVTGDDEQGRGTAWSYYVTLCTILHGGVLQCHGNDKVFKESSRAILPWAINVRVIPDRKRIGLTEIVFASVDRFRYGYIQPEGFVAQSPVVEFKTQISDITGLSIANDVVCVAGLKKTPGQPSIPMMWQYSIGSDAGRYETVLSGLTIQNEASSGFEFGGSILKSRANFLYMTDGVKIISNMIKRPTGYVDLSQRPAGVSSYRLMAVDLDGTKSESGNLSLDVTTDFFKVALNFYSNTTGYSGQKLLLASYSHNYLANAPVFEASVEGHDEIEVKVRYSDIQESKFDASLTKLSFSSIEAAGDDIYFMAQEATSEEEKDQFLGMRCTDSSTNQYTCSKLFGFSSKYIVRGFQVRAALFKSNIYSLLVSGNDQNGFINTILVNLYNDGRIASEFRWIENFDGSAITYSEGHFLAYMGSQHSRDNLLHFAIFTPQDAGKPTTGSINLLDYGIDLCPTGITFLPDSNTFVMTSVCPASKFAHQFMVRDLTQPQILDLVSSSSISSYSQPGVCATKSYIHYYDLDPSVAPSISSIDQTSSFSTTYKTPLNQAYGIEKISDAICDKESGILYLIGKKTVKKEGENAENSYLVAFSGESISESISKRIHSITDLSSNVSSFAPNSGLNPEGRAKVVLLGQNKLSRVVSLSTYGPSFEVDASKFTEEANLKLNIKITGPSGDQKSNTIDLSLKKLGMSPLIKLKEGAQKINVTIQEQKKKLLTSRKIEETKLYNLEDSLEFQGYISHIEYSGSYDKDKENSVAQRTTEMKKHQWSGFRQTLEGYRLSGNSLLGWAAQATVLYQLDSNNTVHTVAQPVIGTVLAGDLVQVNSTTNYGFAVIKDTSLRHTNLCGFYPNSDGKWITTCGDFNFGEGIEQIKFGYLKNKEDEDDHTNFIISALDNGLNNPEISFYLVKIIGGEIRVTKSESKLTYPQKIITYSSQTIFNSLTNKNNVMIQGIMSHHSEIQFAGLTVDFSENSAAPTVGSFKTQSYDVLKGAPTRVQGTSVNRKSSLLDCNTLAGTSAQPITSCFFVNQGVYSYSFKVSLNGIEQKTDDLISNSTRTGSFENLRDYQPVYLASSNNSLVVVGKREAAAPTSDGAFNEDLLVIVYYQNSSSPYVIVKGSQLGLMEASSIQISPNFVPKTDSLGDDLLVYASINSVGALKRFSINPFTLEVGNPEMISPKKDTLKFFSFTTTNPVTQSLGDFVINEDDPAHDDKKSSKKVFYFILGGVLIVMVIVLAIILIRSVGHVAEKDVEDQYHSDEGENLSKKIMSLECPEKMSVNDQVSDDKSIKEEMDI